MLIYGQYIILGYSYYKIIVEGYEAYKKGKFAYDILTFPFRKKAIEDDPKIIMIEEKDDFMVIHAYE